GLRRCRRELVAAAYYERVELVPRVQLRCRVPVETGLFGGRHRARMGPAPLRNVGAVARQGRESAVLAHARRSGILLRSCEVDGVDLKAEVVDRFLNQVRVPLADILELRRGNAHKERLALHVREARRLQPRLERMAIDLLLERTENADPLIQNGGGRRNE